jgi:exonuclease III
MNRGFMIEDIKLEIGTGDPAVLHSLPAPNAHRTHLRRQVRQRMGSLYARKTVDAVRLVNSGGHEEYRWTWLDEQARRQKFATGRGKPIRQAGDANKRLLEGTDES